MFTQRQAGDVSQQHANQFRNSNGRNLDGRRPNNHRDNRNSNFQQQHFQQQMQHQQRSNPSLNSSNQNFPTSMNSSFNFPQPRQMNMNHITCFKYSKTGHKAFQCPNDMEEARFCWEGGRRMNDSLM